MRVIRDGQTPPPPAGRPRRIGRKERADGGQLAIDVALLDYLRQLAVAGQQRPNNPVLARRWNRSPAAIGLVLQRLETRGRIRRLPRCVIEIVATGQRTAPRSWKFKRSAQQELVYRFYAELAQQGAVAPSMLEVGRRLGLTGSSMSAIVRALHKRGELRLHGDARRPGFFVEIVATGARTRPADVRPYTPPAATLRQQLAALQARVEAIEAKLGEGR